MEHGLPSPLLDPQDQRWRDGEHGGIDELRLTVIDLRSGERQGADEAGAEAPRAEAG